MCILRCSTRPENRHETRPLLLQAAGHRRAGALSRASGAARAHDPFRAAAHREGPRARSPSSPGRSTSCSAIWRTRSPPRPRRRRARASSPWRRRSTSAPPGCGPASTRSNSPWMLDDVTQIVGEVGDKLDVVMLPKVEGPWDIHYLDQLLAQLEARHGVTQADPDPRHPGDGRGREERRGRSPPPPRACTA